MQNERSEPSDDAESREVVARRSPRYGRFMVLGGVVFVIAAAIVTYSFPAQQGIDRNGVFGLVALFAAALGVGVGGLLALILDRAARRRAGTVRIAREPASADDAATEATSTEVETTEVEYPQED